MTPSEMANKILGARSDMEISDYTHATQDEYDNAIKAHGFDISRAYLELEAELEAEKLKAGRYREALEQICSEFWRIAKSTLATNETILGSPKVTHWMPLPQPPGEGI